MKLTNMMIDIETCGQRPSSPVLSIGAVFFDPATGTIGDEFYAAVDPVDAFHHGVPDGSTFKWWMEQPDAARKAAVGGKKPLADALSDLASLGDRGAKWSEIKVWGNGPSFDMTILEYAYHRALGRSAPWSFWNVFDCRTVAALAGKRAPKIATSAGVYHNALDDARHQAQWVSAMWREIKGLGSAPVAQSSTLLDL